MGSNGYQEKINSIAELLIEINKKTINNFDSSKSEDKIKDGYLTTINEALQRYNDAEKDDISDTISKALSKLNDEGKKIALQELESMALYDNTNELIDSNGRVNIAEIRKITVNLVHNTIQANARYGVDVIAETQGRTNNEPTFAEQAFDLAVATKIISNFAKESKENQDYVLNNMFNLTLEDYNKVQETVLDMVKKSDKYTPKQKHDFEFLVEDSKVLREPIGNNEYLISEFLKTNPPPELVEQLNEMIDNGTDISAINEWIKEIAQQSYIKNLINHKDEDNSMHAQKDEIVAYKFTGAVNIARLREEISNIRMHNPTNQTSINELEQQLKKYEEYNKRLNEKEQKLDARMSFVETSYTNEEKSILQFGGFDITDKQMPVIDDLISKGNKTDVIQQYTKFKKNNFEQINGITLDVISKIPGINLEEVKKLIEEYEFDPTKPLFVSNIPEYLKERGIIKEEQVFNITEMIQDSEQYIEMYGVPNDKENILNKQKTNEELIQQEIMELPNALLRSNMSKKDAQEVMTVYADYLKRCFSNGSVIEKIDDQEALQEVILGDDDIEEYINNGTINRNDKEKIDVLRMLGNISFHDKLYDILGNKTSRAKFFENLDLSIQQLTPNTERPAETLEEDKKGKITDEELLVMFGKLKPQQIKTDAIVEENTTDRREVKSNTEETGKIKGSTSEKKVVVASPEEFLSSKNADETIIEESVSETTVESPSKKEADKVKQEQSVRTQQDVQSLQTQVQQEQKIAQNDEIALVTTNPNSFINKLKRAWSILTQQKKDDQDNKIGIFKRIKDSLSILTGNENKGEVENQSQQGKNSKVDIKSTLEKYNVSQTPTASLKRTATQDINRENGDKNNGNNITVKKDDDILEL